MGDAITNVTTSMHNGSKSFATVNIHTLVGKLLQTNIPLTTSNSLQIISKDAKITQHSGTTHPQHANSKTVVPQGGNLSPMLFNLYTSDIPQAPTGTSHFICRRHHHNINTHMHQRHTYNCMPK